MNIINLRTEYSFKQVYGHLIPVLELLASRGTSMVCISDFNNTFGHIPFNNACQKLGIKPVFGVTMGVVEKPDEKIRQTPNYMPLIAMNNDGLKEIYEFVGLAYQHFYHVPRIGYHHINQLSENVVVLSGPWCNHNRIEREIFTQLSPDSPPQYIKEPWSHEVAALNNYYPTPEDKSVWQIFAGPQRFETTNQHILTEAEWRSLVKKPENHPYHPADNALVEADRILNDADVTLKQAPMVKYSLPEIGIGHIRQKHASSESSSEPIREEIFLLDTNTRPSISLLEELCEAGAQSLDLDITSEPYKSRLERELSMIEEKDFADYFLIVSDLVNYAKTIMLVGPSRGSSGGSLVCYLTGITEIDPLEFDLLFERFIDINRMDLPDIDVDFPDTKGHLAMEYLMEKYGAANVARIGTISTMGAKSCINEFSKTMLIPEWETKSLKASIIERADGDTRSNQCVEDTFKTEAGKAFLKTYPEMQIAEKIEGHARHTSTHAAGIIVSVDAISNYAGMDLRENVAMFDKKNAEYDAGLLKIDALRLRTLSIIEDVCIRINKPFSWLYTLPLDDEASFDLLGSLHFPGIFQFEGDAVANLARKVGVEDFNDIVAITALARPGPLGSGGADLFAERKTGKKEIRYLHDHPTIVEITKDTLGVIVYQEQVMKIVRQLGHLSWEDTTLVRKTMGKSLGVEALERFYLKFLKGCNKEGITTEDCRSIWDNITTFGSYGFNLAHAVGYGLISYQTAYLKAHYPLEFTTAVLNHPGSGDNGKRNCIKLLREFVEKGFTFEPVNLKESIDRWEVRSDGKSIMGPLTNVKGIGQKKCEDMIERRKINNLTDAQIKLMTHGEIQYSELWPTKKQWGDYYTNPEKFNIMNHDLSQIENIHEKGQYVFIGRLIEKNLKDLNEHSYLIKRKGKKVNGQPLFMTLVLEDDTGTIPCMIDKNRFNKYGRDIADSGEVDEDWFLVMGMIKDNWRSINVQNIRKLNPV